MGYVDQHGNPRPLRTVAESTSPDTFPRWIMAACTNCGGAVPESSPYPHPSWPTCSCRVRETTCG